MAKKTDEDFQNEIKQFLGLTYLTKAKLDAYSANLYLLKDIWKNQSKSEIHHLGYDDPNDIPYYPSGFAYQASTSGSKYNVNLIEIGQQMVEYDFSEAYTNIMRTYYLPSNTFLKNVKYDREKIEKRFSEYPDKTPYRNLKTFAFLKVKITASAKENTYTDIGGMFFKYTAAMFEEEITVSEIELKLIYDFYDIKKLEVIDSYVFRTRQGLLDDYFDRIDILKDQENTLKFYKQMRNKIYGTIGKTGLNKADERIFKFPVYNRAFSAAVAGIFRDRIARYEQKYVYSDYGLLMIKTDGLYFRNEVPEFERLTQLGIVKKKIHEISEEKFR